MFERDLSGALISGLTCSTILSRSRCSDLERLEINEIHLFTLNAQAAQTLFGDRPARGLIGFKWDIAATINGKGPVAADVTFAT